METLEERTGHDGCVPGGEATGALGRFFDGAPVLAATASSEGFLTQLGGAWSEVLGWSEEELTSRPFIDFIHPEDVASTLEALDDLVEGERVTGFDNRYRTADGRWLWLRWHASANEIVAETQRQLAGFGALAGVAIGAVEMLCVPDVVPPEPVPPEPVPSAPVLPAAWWADPRVVPLFVMTAGLIMVRALES